jgi:hypothetical protein
LVRPLRLWEASFLTFRLTISSVWSDIAQKRPQRKVERLSHDNKERKISLCLALRSVHQLAEAPRRACCGNGASMIDEDVISADHGTRHEDEKRHVRDVRCQRHGLTSGTWREQYICKLVEGGHMSLPPHSLSMIPTSLFFLLYGMADRDGFLMRMFNFLEWKSA